VREGVRFDTDGGDEKGKGKKQIDLSKRVVETQGVVAKVGDVDSRVQKVVGGSYVCFK